VTHASRIRNVTRGKMLASSAIWAVTNRERRRGLLGLDGLAPGEALIITRCRQVHTFGMRFPIEVVFIDRAGTVVGSRRMQPGRVSRPCLRAREAIELPVGTIARTGTRVGDTLLLGPD
jgi:uncharacterized protein